MLKLFKSRSKVKVMVTCVKVTVPSKRSCHKENIYAIYVSPILYSREVIGIIKVFKVGQMSRERN